MLGSGPSSGCGPSQAQLPSTSALTVSKSNKAQVELLDLVIWFDLMVNQSSVYPPPQIPTVSS